MKRLFFLIFVIISVPIAVFCLVFSLVETRQEKVLDSLGSYETERIWSHGYQDVTEFGMYSYASVKIDNHQYFTAISETDIETICTFIDDFEEWIDAIEHNDPNDELVLNYAFDRSMIDTNDYFYIYEAENIQKFHNYDVWFFDSQTKVLYYFHNNI